MAGMIGREIGPYRIVEQIGIGGMATVYKAYHAVMDRYVAVKVMPEQMSQDENFRRRFEREAKAVARLEHAHILPVYDYGEVEGRLYLVMRYIDAGTLKDLMAARLLDLAEVSRIIRQVGRALEYAHQMGVVHRDVKPSNVLMDAQGDCYLTDFGLAKMLEASVQLTATGVGVGTPAYMSPEQGKGEKVDARSDIYSLGVMLYEMVTGQVPYQAETPLAVVLKHVTAPLPLPREVKPDIPEGVERVILRALAKNPDDRFQAMGKMVATLDAAVSGAMVEEVKAPRPVVAPPTAPPAPKAIPTKALALGGGALLAGGLVLLAIAGIIFTVYRGILTASKPGPPTVTSVALVAIAPTPTNTWTPTLPPTYTPMAYPTSTPVPTDTLEPTPTRTPPPPTPTPACAFEVQGLFAGLWQTHRNQLGCPLQRQPQAIYDAEQLFQNGHMFWREDNNYAYVVYEEGERSGTFQAFTGLWSEGDPEYSCSASPPAGLFQPKRGFGAVWCQLGAASAPIGWALGGEGGFGPGNGDPLAQDFERGMIFRDSDGKTWGMAYVLFADGTFVRNRY